MNKLEFYKNAYVNWFQGKIIELCIEFNRRPEVIDEIEKLLDFCIKEKPYVGTPRVCMGSQVIGLTDKCRKYYIEFTDEYQLCNFYIEQVVFYTLLGDWNKAKELLDKF